VEYMGGADAVLERAKKDFEAGNYRWVAQVLNHLIFAEPGNEAAKSLQADTLEQLGYQAENGTWRDFYLSGAKELREGVKVMPTPVTASPDTVAAMTMDMFLDYLGILLIGPKAAPKTYRFNLVMSDANETYGLEVENGALNHTKGLTLDDPTATITLARATINEMIFGETTMEKAVSQGDVKIDGNADAFTEFLGLLDTFNFWYNVVTPIDSDAP